MNFLAVRFFFASLRISIWLNKLTGRSSKECMHKLQLGGLIFFALLRASIELIHRDWFGAGLSLAIWAVMYPAIHLMEVNVFRKEFWKEVEHNYQPPNVLICPLVLPHYNWKARLFDIKLWAFLAAVQSFFTLFSLFMTWYMTSFLAFTSVILFSLCGLWSANNFFYHQINNTSLYSKLKKWVRQKMENREKVSVLAPIPA